MQKNWHYLENSCSTWRCCSGRKTLVKHCLNIYYIYIISIVCGGEYNAIQNCNRCSTWRCWSGSKRTCDNNIGQQLTELISGFKLDPVASCSRYIWDCVKKTKWCWHWLSSSQQWKRQVSNQVSHIWCVVQFCFGAWVALFWRVFLSIFNYA